MTNALLDPADFYRRIPLQPHQLVDRRTRTEDIIVLCHLGVPRVRPDDWSLEIGGLVRSPITLRLSELMTRPKTTVTSVHQCAGSPLDPETPTRRISNVAWSGVRLADLLDHCGVLPTARYVWSTGMDHGSFGGVACPSFVKDLPLERVSADVLVAYELNGEPLPPENGFPARLVVPGYYGTNSVKWLSRIELAERRSDGPFTTLWYNDPVRGTDGQPTGETRPVWSIAPEAVIVAPSPDAILAVGKHVEIWGWAWADGGVDHVEVSLDGGTTWLVADVETAEARCWQRFRYTWVPASTGAPTISVRARAGECIQPAIGARNAIHTVHVEVR